MRRRRGFTVLELLATIPCLVVAFAVSMQLFRVVIQMDASSAATSNHFAQTDSAVRQLRGDVWGCERITVDGPVQATLEFDGGKKIVWRVEEDGLVSRTDFSSEVKRWPGTGQGWSFSQEGACLVVSAKTSDGRQELGLVSQVLMGRNAQ